MNVRMPGGHVLSVPDLPRNNIVILVNSAPPASIENLSVVPGVQPD